MQLASVSFENFKSFKKRIDLDINRITYLIGPNGAGKSNVLAGINLISGMIKNGDRPGPDDCFDGMYEEPTTLSFTAKLSEDERHNLIIKTRDRGRTASPDNRAFELLRYEASFQNNQKTRQQLLLSNVGGALRLVQDLVGDNEAYQLGHCALEDMYLGIEHILTQDTSQTSDMTVGDFLAYFDRDVHHLVLEMLTLRQVRERKEFPISAPVGGDPNISSDGENLPNQLLTMFNDRPQIQKFGNKIGRLSSGGIAGIDSKVLGSDAVIQLQEKWRKDPTPASEINSGYYQQVILLSCLDRFKEPILTIEEPELHLHAAAQKNLLDFIRKSLPNKQVIITTHSSIFVNSSEAESTFLLSKNAEGTAAAPISESNVHLIRSSLGIGSEDAFDSEHLCCVEGRSEKIAIPALARKLGYRVGLSPWMLDLKGYGNARHLEPLLEYLGMSEKKFCVLLDKNGQARRHVDRLLDKGLFTEEQCCFLEDNFEDLFPSTVLAEYSVQLAEKHGVAFGLSAGDLDWRRRKGSVTNALEEEWQKQSSGHNYPKTELAELLASTEPGDIPEAAAVVHRIMAVLGVAPG